MNTKGFVKVPRALMEREWFSNHNARNLFFQLLLTANFADDGKVARGQVATSYAQLSDSTGLSKQQLRTALTLLEKEGVITREATRHATSQRIRIIVCEFDSYQGQATSEQHHEQHHEQHGEQEERKCTKKEEDKEEFSEEEKGGPEPLTLTPPNPVEEKKTKKARRQRTFTPPSVEEVAQYVADHQLAVDAQYFWDYYACRGWRTQGRYPFTDWKHKLHDWSRRETLTALPVAVVSATTTGTSAAAPAAAPDPMSTLLPASLQTTNHYATNYLNGGRCPHRSFTKTEANLNALAKLRELESTPYDMPPEDIFD